MNSPIRLDSPGTLSDNRLIRQLESLRGNERKVLTGILLYLVEMERRKLYLPRGYSSLFEFCTHHLKYSRSAAGKRVAAARAFAKFPSLEGYLLNGQINLYSLSLVSGILTADNLERVIAGIRNRPTREVEALVAGFRPGRIIRDRVRPVCVMVPDTRNKRDRSNAVSAAGRSSKGNPSPATGVNAGTTPGAGSRQLSDPDMNRIGKDTLERVRISRRYKLEFAVDSEFMKKFERMKALLSGRYPGGISFEELFMLLMDEYIDRNSPEGRAARRENRRCRGSRKALDVGHDNKSHQELGSTESSNSHHDGKLSDNSSGGESTAAAGADRTRSRKIPRRVRDAVFLRDGGRCTFIGPDGRRCGSRWNLQIDHIVPFARHGDNSPGNLRLLCGKHNRHEAERVYGGPHMDRFRKKE